MKIFPFERINYRTRLSEDEIIKRLNHMVEPEKLLLFRFLSRKLTKPYEGHINTRKFSIRRIIDYGNSFHPRIKGELQKGSNGITINIKMRLNIYAIIFLIIWYGAIGFAFIILLTSQLLDRRFNPAILILLGFIAFAYALSRKFFKLESDKSIKDLSQILELEEIK